MSQRVFKKYDKGLIGAALVLIVISLVTLASGDRELFFRQLVWVAVAISLIFGLPLLNLRALFQYRWVVMGIYFFVLALLILTYFAAPIISGARSWIVFGPVQIQPSEFMKAALIILLSSFFAVRHIAIARIGIIFASFAYFLIPAIFVLLQPDAGTGMVLFGIWFGYLLLSGMPARYIITAVVIFSILGVAAWNIGFADYQKARIIGLFRPDIDSLGVNYSVAQSKIAIGSAGFLGKGFGQGTQVQLGFLPTAQTDFVFAAFVEEWGIIGGTVLISAMIFLIYRVLRLGIRSRNNFTRFISLGTALMLFLHFFINLGSTLGLLPVIGIGLPFVSYGGSNLLTASALIGIMQGVADSEI